MINALKALAPVRSIPPGKYARHGQPLLYGVVRRSRRRVTVAWLGLNVVLRLGLRLLLRMKYPGHFGGEELEQLQSRVFALEQKNEALAEVLRAREVPVDAARALVESGTSQWPRLAVNLSDRLNESDQKIAQIRNGTHA